MPLNNMTSNGIDTSDATATVSDIMPGKTAYVNDIKLTGTATADATATENDILNGKTAYIKGIKKTGNISTIGSTPGTVYNTDGNGNFGILVPYTGYYQQNTILYANAATAGITPEKILQGQSILGVEGTVSKQTVVNSTECFTSGGNPVEINTPYGNAIPLLIKNCGATANIYGKTSPYGESNNLYINDSLTIPAVIYIPKTGYSDRFLVTVPAIGSHYARLTILDNSIHVIVDSFVSGNKGIPIYFKFTQDYFTI